MAFIKTKKSSNKLFHMEEYGIIKNGKQSIWKIHKWENYVHKCDIIKIKKKFNQN